MDTKLKLQISENALVITGNMPHVDEIDVQAEELALTIKGRAQGQVFKQTIRLPTKIDPEDAMTVFDSGRLIIALPKNND